jgi:hypothetical protein
MGPEVTSQMDRLVQLAREHLRPDDLSLQVAETLVELRKLYIAGKLDAQTVTRIQVIKNNIAFKTRLIPPPKARLKSWERSSNILDWDFG